MNCSSTARRILGAVVALGFVAMAGSALAQSTLGYADDFEADTTVSPYAWADGEGVTNAPNWYNDLDKSVIVTTNNPSWVEFSAIGFPITPTANNQVIDLDTGGGTLTNLFSMTIDEAPKVFIDTMVSLVPSDTLPVALTNGTDLGNQMAVMLNANSNLVVLHGGTDGARYYTAITNTVLPNTWYRLTITMDYDSGDGGVPIPDESDYFQVKLNGTALESDDAYAQVLPNQTTFTVGSWFRAANTVTAADDKINSICFQGTGFIDDLAVTSTDPFGGGPTIFYTIYTTVGANGASDAAAEEEVAEGGDLTIIYTANDWYRINALLLDGTPVGAAAGQKAYTQEFTNVTQDYSNDVSFATATQGQTGLTVPTDYADYYATEAEAAADPNLFDDWLVNNPVPLGSGPYAMQVTSIAKSGTTVTVVVKLTENGTPLQVTDINGELVLFGASTAGGSYTRIGTTAITGADFDVNGLATIPFTSAPAADFLYAVIQQAP
jgi:hypothetical protein